jgi:hypothetical protein
MQEEQYQDPNQFLGALQPRVLEAVDEHSDPKDEIQQAQQPGENAET